MKAVEPERPSATISRTPDFRHAWVAIRLGLAVLALGFGTAMFPFPSLGPAGLPLVLIGVPLTFHALLRFSGEGQPPLRNLILGSILLAAGVFALVVSIGQTALTVNRWLLADPSWNELLSRLLQMTILWLAGPTILAVALRLRQPEPGQPWLLVWLLLLLAGPISGLATLLLGAWMLS